jgi:alcohol dehydrogenase (cytochrome c)
MPYPTLLLASVLATAGDLVFIGDPEGNFVAHDARNGARLWSFQNGAGHRGATVSYAVNGRQYIAVTTGWQQNIAGGTALNLFPGQQFRSGSTVVVFALPDGSR